MLGYFLWSLAAFVYLGVGARVYLDVSEDFPNVTVLGNPVVASSIVLLWPAMLVISLPVIVLVIFGHFIIEAIEDFQERRKR